MSQLLSPYQKRRHAVKKPSLHFQTRIYSIKGAMRKGIVCISTFVPSADTGVDRGDDEVSREQGHSDTKMARQNGIIGAPITGHHSIHLSIRLKC